MGGSSRRTGFVNWQRSTREYTRGSISELVAFLEENPLKGSVSWSSRSQERRLNLEEVDLIKDRYLGQEGWRRIKQLNRSPNNTACKVSSISLPSRVGKVGSRMEIRMAYPNEIKRIMEIIQDAKESLAQRQVDRSGRMAIEWRDHFEDILEKVIGYVALKIRKLSPYAAVHKEMKRPIMRFTMWWGMATICISLSPCRCSQRSCWQRVAQTFLQGLIRRRKRASFRCDTHADNLVMQRLRKIGLCVEGPYWWSPSGLSKIRQKRVCPSGLRRRPLGPRNRSGLQWLSILNNFISPLKFLSIVSVKKAL